MARSNNLYHTICEFYYQIKIINKMNMTLRSLFVAILTIAIMAGGCKKKDSSANPCDGLVNETPPTSIMVMLVEKTTGENLILSKKIQAADITVINTNSGKPFESWGVVKESTGSPFNGALKFSVFDQTAGQYGYQVNLGALGTVTLAYTISKTATNDPCKPTAYPVSEIKITDHSFTPFIYQGKSYANVLVLEL
jgi:hypothetical protein